MSDRKAGPKARAQNPVPSIDRGWEQSYFEPYYPRAPLQVQPFQTGGTCLPSMAAWCLRSLLSVVLDLRYLFQREKVEQVKYMPSPCSSFFRFWSPVATPKQLPK